ncbi:hypothetical protein B853_21806 [Vibrio rotiferianus CAIM 577 = LMG 21460]|nr:hypothetical protein B853_21806 [Vibrio rotiferianus CAIM 577 = LMG 21460]
MLAQKIPFQRTQYGMPESTTLANNERNQQVPWYKLNSVAPYITVHHFKDGKRDPCSTFRNDLTLVIIPVRCKAKVKSMRVKNINPMVNRLKFRLKR